MCAFLDDVYVVGQPGRVRFLFNLLAEALGRVAGIQLHEGKTRVWNRSQTQPDNIDELGPEVWQPRGITVLGTPIGCAEYVSEKMTKRIETERKLWDMIPFVPDLQCAWQLLVQSANPRAIHSLRTLPPSQSSEFAVAHDEGLWGVAEILLDIQGSAGNKTQSRSPVCRCAWADWVCVPHRDAPKVLTGPHGQMLYP